VLSQYSITLPVRFSSDQIGNKGALINIVTRADPTPPLLGQATAPSGSVQYAQSVDVGEDMIFHYVTYTAVPHPSVRPMEYAGPFGGGMFGF
jgi:hypothetical protein